MNYDKAIDEMLFLTHRLHSTALKDAVNLHRGELAILGYLHDKQNIVTPSVLSDFMKISTARVTASLNKLEKKGFITRCHSKDDRRKVNVAITALGSETFVKIQENVKNNYRQLFNILGENDVKELIRILKRICDSTEW